MSIFPPVSIFWRPAWGLVVCLAALALPMRAEDLASLSTSAAKDAEKALADLAGLRKTVEGERVPLSRELAALEQKLTDRRAELAKAQRFQENQLVELNALKAEARKKGVLRTEGKQYIVHDGDILNILFNV